MWLVPFGVLATSPGNAQSGPGGIEQTNGTSALELWLRADSEVFEDAGMDLAESGDPVLQWNDQSGNGRHIQQTTLGNRPVLTEGILNGNPILRFTASSNHYLGPLAADLFQSDYSIFIVGFGSNSNQDILAYTFGVNHGILIECSTGNQLRLLHRNALGTSGGDNVIAGTTRSNSASQVLSFSRGLPAAGTQQFWINGGDNQTTVGTNAVLPSGGVLVLGRLSGAVSNRYLNGDLAEVIIIDREVNDVERIIIENYLAAKYGIALAANDLYDEDEPGNGNFDKEVAGIGRLNASNIQSDAQGSGIVRILAPTDLNDDEFLFWGHNNGTQQASETSDVPPGVQARFDRTWRVSEVNSAGGAVDVGDIDIRWNLSGLGSVTASDLRLLIDTDDDGSFADETPIPGASSAGGSSFEFAGVSAISNNRRFTLGTINNITTPLPVELLFFDAKVANNSTVNLVWQTASEVNNDFFSIERSKDLQTWETLKTVDGAGNSVEQIAYADSDPAPYLGTSYYRLKQTDFDGNFSYSETKAVNLNGVEIITSFPNPSAGLIQLQVTSSVEAKLQMKVYDSGGKLVYSTDGEVLVEGLNTLSYDLSELGSGTYQLAINTSDGQYRDQTLISINKR